MSHNRVPCDVNTPPPSVSPGAAASTLAARKTFAVSELLE